MRSRSGPVVAVLAAALVLALGPVGIGGHVAQAASDMVVIELGAHRFDQTQAPQAIVAVALPGDGPDEVGVACPIEGECSLPSSFDVAADGTVWVTDAVNRRVLAWAPGRPDRPSQVLPLAFAPADLALAPDGTIYVTGLRPGIDRSMQLFALDADGRQVWRSALPVEGFSFNSHIRIGPGGILFGAFRGSDSTIWTPAVRADGRPVDPAEQLRLAEPAQPLAGGQRLQVTGSTEPGHDAPIAWDIVLRGASGETQRRWRIVAADDIGLCLEAEPAMVDGDLIIVFEVYRYADHVMEHVVLRLAPTGLADRLSLPRGGYRGALTVTDIRIGANARLYQLHADPETGMSIVRYELAGGPTPTEAPTVTPTLPSTAGPTVVPTATQTAGPTATPDPTITGSPGVLPPPVAGGPDPGAVAAVIVAATLTVVIAVLLVAGRRTSARRTTPSR